MKNPSFLLSESGVSRKAIPTQTKKQADGTGESPAFFNANVYVPEIMH
jgi:hypothetical protein